jgi:tRNA 2-thiocytidine biosynthesis protein TtcA
VIRPLAYISETDLIAYADWKQFPIIPCDLCGSQENLKRKEVTRMLQEWDKKYPGRAWNVFKALANVTPSHLMDQQLFDFVGLKPDGRNNPLGDTAFDPVSIPADITAVENNSGTRSFPSWTLHVDPH